MKQDKKMVRTFGENSGCRDLDKDKLDYEGFISPLVLQAYAEYMHKNRHLKDGTLRASDNWQKGFGLEHKSVCMKSLWRHFMDLWMFHRGHTGRETIDEAICGILFNAMAYYHKILDDRVKDGK